MRLLTALTGVVLLVVLAGCGADQSSHNTTSESSIPFEVIMDDTVVATCDRIRTHTHAMVECMDDNWGTIGYFSVERVTVVRKSNEY